MSDRFIVINVSAGFKVWDSVGDDHVYVFTRDAREASELAAYLNTNALPIVTTPTTAYVPYADAGSVGYRVVNRDTGHTRGYVYLQPSIDEDLDSTPDVFVYQGRDAHNITGADAVVYLDTNEGNFDHDS